MTLIFVAVSLSNASQDINIRTNKRQAILYVHNIIWMDVNCHMFLCRLLTKPSPNEVECDTVYKLYDCRYMQLFIYLLYTLTNTIICYIKFFCNI